MTTAQDGDKVVSLTYRPPLPPGNAPGTHSVTGSVDPRSVVLSEGFYVNEKFQASSFTHGKCREKNNGWAGPTVGQNTVGRDRVTTG